jgi:N-acetyl-1-D-myo-inositol-2-amino-2-deoxy-alpha-D-glucopyranoside deacetylase
MAAPAAELHGCSLLAIFAHPDDESLACGGLLAWCAHRGARVSLLCLTDGRQDQGDRLGRVRAQELRAACRVLGVADLELLGHEDGMLPWVDGGQLEADIQRAIHRVRPDVVLTFDEDGLYWHPDHIAVHERTTAIVAAAGVDGPALYYVTIPPGSMRAVVQHAREILASRGQDRPSPLQILGIADPDAFGAVAPAPTTIVDAAEFAGRKLAAIRCHRSQLIDDALDLVDTGDAARLLGMEHYRRAAVGFPGDTFIDRLPSPLTT